MVCRQLRQSWLPNHNSKKLVAQANEPTKLYYATNAILRWSCETAVSTSWTANADEKGRLVLCSCMKNQLRTSREVCTNPSPPCRFRWPMVAHAFCLPAVAGLGTWEPPVRVRCAFTALQSAKPLQRACPAARGTAVARQTLQHEKSILKMPQKSLRSPACAASQSWKPPWQRASRSVLQFADVTFLHWCSDTPIC